MSNDVPVPSEPSFSNSVNQRKRSAYFLHCYTYAGGFVGDLVGKQSACGFPLLGGFRGRQHAQQRRETNLSYMGSQSAEDACLRLRCASMKPPLVCASEICDTTMAKSLFPVLPSPPLFLVVCLQPSQASPSSSKSTRPGSPSPPEPTAVCGSTRDAVAQSSPPPWPLTTHHSGTSGNLTFQGPWLEMWPFDCFALGANSEYVPRCGPSSCHARCKGRERQALADSGCALVRNWKSKLQDQDLN